jgi:hypothetical protein
MINRVSCNWLVKKAVLNTSGGFCIKDINLGGECEIHRENFINIWRSNGLDQQYKKPVGKNEFKTFIREKKPCKDEDVNNADRYGIRPQPKLIGYVIPASP